MPDGTALPLLAVSDTVWLALIPAVASFALAWLQYRTASGVKSATKKLDDVAKVAAATHGLVNGGTGALLHLHATTARALAKQTKSDYDVEVADSAERACREHDEKRRAAEGATAQEAEPAPADVVLQKSEPPPPTHFREGHDPTPSVKRKRR